MIREIVDAGIPDCSESQDWLFGGTKEVSCAYNRPLNAITLPSVNCRDHHSNPGLVAGIVAGGNL